ncbi:hypothetical protein [Natrinema sp. DC36]|uniref:hypothetical protein n=1 Tax=Natrinema sp. DC36 TaxID=2878680 RepID=UPI001CF0CC25|nr:hypothetical protein [Natrinema sp. DC36]
MAEKRIRQTLEPNRNREFIVDGESIAFDRGVQVRPVTESRAEVLLDHPHLELDIDLPADYRDLQKMAARAESDTVNGNSSRDEIVDHLEGLPAEKLEGLRDDL